MADLMTPFGPFESSPHIAVAVSGGSDSMALVLLADAWARARGGRVTALTVDHGLRSGSGDEAVQVADWLAVRGIAHEILCWQGPKPDTGVQSKAREARYRLLKGWCREAGVLHLLLAHQREDQAETLMLRLGAGSGLDGLAAMSAIVEDAHVRLLRPVLGVSRAALVATLKAYDQDWVEDPSNEDTKFARVRIRQTLMLAGEGQPSVSMLVETAGRMARARTSLEAEASRHMAHSCRVHASGYAAVDTDALFATGDEISLRVLGRLLMCIGGRDHTPRLEKLERLHQQMKLAIDIDDWPGVTLSRCRVLLVRGTFLVCRERRDLPTPTVLNIGEIIDWDRRFALSLDESAKMPLTLAPLGLEGWNEIVNKAPEIKALGIPRVAGLTLPSLIDDQGVAAVAHLYRRSETAPGFQMTGFHPPRALSATGFVVAN